MKRKPITPAEREREYKRCIAREKDRYREWAKTRQGAFETYQILHFDAEAEEAREREHSTSWLSDRGKGAAEIRRCVACPEEKRLKRRRDALTSTYMMVRRKLPHCLKTFRLVLENGTNRKESIWAIAKTRRAWRTASRLYWRQLAKLIDLLEGRRGQDGTQGTARPMGPSRVS